MQVIEIWKTVLGPEYPETLISLGRLGETEKLLVQVIKIKKTVIGPEHPETLTTTMWCLSLTLKDLRRHTDEALSMLQDCVQLQNQRLGPSCPIPTL